MVFINISYLLYSEFISNNLFIFHFAHMQYGMRFCDCKLNKFHKISYSRNNAPPDTHW